MQNESHFYPFYAAIVIIFWSVNIFIENGYKRKFLSFNNSFYTIIMLTFWNMKFLLKINIFSAILLYIYRRGMD